MVREISRAELSRRENTAASLRTLSDYGFAASQSPRWEDWREMLDL